MTSDLKEELATTISIDWPTRINEALSLGAFLDFSVEQDLDADALLEWTVSNADSMPSLAAEVLRDALIGFSGTPDPRGLELRGVRIVGILDLDFSSLNFPLRFHGVRIEESLWLESFQGTDFHIYNSVIKNDVLLVHAELSKRLIIKNCRVEGAVLASGLSCGELDLSSTHILGRAQESTTDSEGSGGEVSGTPIGENSQNVQTALDGRMLEVRGNADMSNMVVTGEIDLVGGRIGGYLQLADTRVQVTCIAAPPTPCREYAIVMDTLSVGGVLGMGGVKTNCSIRIRGARIGGQLRMEGAACSAAWSESACQIDLNEIEVGNSAILTNIEAGGLYLQDAATKELSLVGARINRVGNDCVDASGSSFSNVYLNSGEFRGWVDLQGTRIAGILNLWTAPTEQSSDKPSKPTRIAALNLSRAHIERGVAMTGAAISPGGIVADRATILGTFSIKGGSSLDRIHPTGDCFRAEGASFQHLRIDGDTKLHGNIVLNGAEASRIELGGIAPAVQVEETPPDTHPGSRRPRRTPRVPKMPSFQAREAVIQHLEIRGETSWRGDLDLGGSTITHLNIGNNESTSAEAGRMPTVKNTTSVTFSNVSGPPFHTWTAARDWLGQDALDRVPDSKRKENRAVFQSQPWLEVAKAFEADGRESEGRRLRFESTDRRLASGGNWFSRTIWRRVTKWTIGHGYYSVAAIGWLAMLWLVSATLVGLNTEAFTPTDRSTALSAVVVSGAGEVPANSSEGKPGAGSASERLITTAASDPAPPAYPSLIAPLYAVDVVLSPLDAGQSTAWQASTTPWLLVLLTMIKLLSWGLLGLFVTGISGLMSRK